MASFSNAELEAITDALGVLAVMLARRSDPQQAWDELRLASGDFAETRPMSASLLARMAGAVAKYCPNVQTPPG